MTSTRAQQPTCTGPVVNAVKTRLRRQSAKLEFTDRRGAALRVAELGLVGPGSDPRGR